MINEGLLDTCVLVNARIIEFREPKQDEKKPTISNFNEFIQEIVLGYYQANERTTTPSRDIYGSSIPLTALPFDHITVLYPVARIGDLMRRAMHDTSTLPSFLDFDDKSVVLKLLRTKLW